MAASKLDKYFSSQDLYTQVTCPYCMMKGELLQRFEGGDVQIIHECAWVRIWQPRTQKWIHCEAIINQCTQGRQRGLAWQKNRIWERCPKPS